MTLKELFDGNGNKHDLDAAKIGDLERLSTDAKDSLVAAVNEVDGRIPKITVESEGAFVRVVNGELALMFMPSASITKYEVTTTYIPDLGQFAYDALFEARVYGISSSAIQSVELLLCKNLGYGEYEEKYSMEVPYVSGGYIHAASESYTQTETYLDAKVRVKYKDSDGVMQTIISATKAAYVNDFTEDAAIVM